MSESQRILARIGAVEYGRASKNFPPAAISKDEFMEGEALDVDGRPVVVKFRRTLYKRHKSTWYAWNLHSARYVDEPNRRDEK